MWWGNKRKRVLVQMPKSREKSERLMWGSEQLELLDGLKCSRVFANLIGDLNNARNCCMDTWMIACFVFRVFTTPLHLLVVCRNSKSTEVNESR